MCNRVAVIFLVIGVGGIFVAIWESINYIHLKEGYESLNNSYNNLQSSYSSLQQDHNLLQQKYDDLESKYNSLNSSYVSLQSLYNDLQSSYSSLQQDYNELMSEYNSLVVQWNDLVKDWNTLMDFLGDRYGNEASEFITPNNPDIISAKNYIILSDGNLSWEDMKVINDWVHNNIIYNNDTFFDYETGQFFGSFWMYPNETLKYRFGDCEEYATLMISLCKAEQNVNWLWCALTNVTDANGTKGHAIVFVNVEDDRLYIFDPTAGWNSSAAMSEQEALNEYCSVFGYDHIDIIAVFDENNYYSFNSNQDFFNWF